MTSSSRTMTLVKCSRKPGYCKHQHSSILHSSSSKGKLLALIECEINLSSLSLFLFLSPYSLWRCYITDDSRRARGFRKVASNVYSLRRDRTFPAVDPRDNLIIPANIRVSATRENLKNPRPKEPTLWKRIRHYLEFPERTFWPIDLFRYYDKIFNAFFSYIKIRR